MSNDSSNSPDAVTTTKTTELEALQNELKEKGVDTERLAILMLGGEQILGEVQEVMPLGTLVGGLLRVKNPKRYMRLQRMTPDGSAMAVDVFVGGLDLIDDDGSEIQLLPVGGYWLKSLGPSSQRELMNTLLMFFKHKLMARVKKAGLITPDGRLNMGGMSGKG